MNQSSPEKERLLMALTDIYDQLEELESVLEGSFSEHRNGLNAGERKKVTESAEKLSILENKVDQIILQGDKIVVDFCIPESSKAFQLEMGF